MASRKKKTSQQSKFPVIALILTALLTLHLIANMWYLSIDSGILRQEAGNNYLTALELLDKLPGETLLGKLKLLYSLSADNIGPTFVLPTALTMGLLGKSWDLAAMVNTFFLGVLVVALYLLGKTMFDKKTGLLAAVLITFYPPIFSLARSIEARLSLAAMVTLALWALIKTERFSSRKYSVTFGLFTGLAALSKPDFSVFLAIPILTVAIPAVAESIRKKDNTELWKRFLNISFAALLAFLLVFPWYSVRLGPYLRSHNKAALGQINPEGLGILLHWGDAWLLGRDLLSDLILWLFVISLPALMLKGKRRVFLLGWMLLPFSVFFVISGRDGGCITQGDGFASMLPAIALITSYGLFYATAHIIPSIAKRYRKIISWTIVGLVISAHILLYLGVTLSTTGGLPFLREPRFVQWARSGCLEGSDFNCSQDELYCLDTDSLNNKAPSDFRFSFDSLLRILPSESASGGPLKIFFFNRDGHFSNVLVHSLREKAMLSRTEPFQEESCLDYEALPAYGIPKTVDECGEEMLSADVIVLEHVFYKWTLCQHKLQYIETLNNLVPNVLFLLDEFDVVYTVRIQQPPFITYSPTSEVYVRGDLPDEVTWSERGIREPTEELLGVVLLRSSPMTTVSEGDITSLEEWLTTECET